MKKNLLIALLAATTCAHAQGPRKVTYNDGELNLCEKNTSSTYKTYTTATSIPVGKYLNVYTSRYTDFYCTLTGKGTLNLYSGGERTFIGEHANKKYADWTGFTGDVHIYKYNKVDASCGFYGVVMGHNGKTFSPENIDDCVKTGKVCNALNNNIVTLHEGAAIAFENGIRAAQYAQLSTEAGSRIYGYYKATAGTGAYLLVGRNNADATMAGTIAPMEKDGKPLNTSLVGLIKEGKGTYTLTANDNCISGGIRVVNGRVNICNDADKAKRSKLSGGTGTPASNAAVAYVFGNGVLGGTGNIAGIIDLYGTIEPGADSPGTLTVKDYSSSNAKASLRLHPASTLRFRIASTECYDQLYVNNEIEFSNIKEDFTTSTASPRIKIVLADSAHLSVGDEFTLLTASKRLNASDWQWSISYPDSLAWEVEERTENNRYTLVLKVTSLNGGEDSGNEDDDPSSGEDEYVSKIDDTTTFKSDGDFNIAIRTYADQKGLRIGVAVPPSRIAIDNTNDNKTSTIVKQFNMLVPENELKWDWVEPSRGTFNFGDGDRLYNLARNNNMYMRGHTLAWHSQVAEWVSVDGKKNDKNWTKQQLMDILKNHILNVVKHYKGKIGEWDVVNECLDEDQSIVRNNPNGYKLRAQSIWTTVCGEEFIDSAFVWAHQADPNAKLYLNDYDNEAMGSAKAQAFYNLAMRLKKAGIPIHGVGFQCHLDAGMVNAKAISQNIARYADTGLECAITELDLGVSSTTTALQQQQARDYYRIVELAMAQPHCRSVLIWGLSDDLSWRGSNPLLWNASMGRKPAYYAVRQAMKDALSDEETGIADIMKDASKDRHAGEDDPLSDLDDADRNDVRSMTFTLSGQRVSSRASSLKHGVYIVGGKKVVR